MENIGKYHFVRQLVFTMVFRGFKLKEINISTALDFSNKDAKWRFFDYLLPMSHNLYKCTFFWRLFEVRLWNFGMTLRVIISVWVQLRLLKFFSHLDLNGPGSWEGCSARAEGRRTGQNSWCRVSTIAAWLEWSHEKLKNKRGKAPVFWCFRIGGIRNASLFLGRLSDLVTYHRSLNCGERLPWISMSVFSLFPSCSFRPNGINCLRVELDQHYGWSTYPS